MSSSYKTYQGLKICIMYSISAIIHWKLHLISDRNEMFKRVLLNTAKDKKGIHIDVLNDYSKSPFSSFAVFSRTVFGAKVWQVKKVKTR